MRSSRTAPAARRTHVVAGIVGVLALLLVAGQAASKVPPTCTKVDIPDLKFKDTNCDGIDGNAKRAVFVAPLGNDAAPGTRARPVRSLQTAVTLAAVRHVDVYAMVGTYDVGTGLVLADHVSIYGGYTTGWKRSATQRVVIAGAPQGVVGTDVHFVTMQMLRVVSSADGNVDRSVYGIRLVRSGVTLDHVTVSAGAGIPGPDGQHEGGQGSAGAAGIMGIVAFGSSAVPGGAGPGYPGGNGGVAGSSGSGQGGSGGAGPGGGAGGSFGAGGAYAYGQNGGPGGDGAPGASGANGSAGGPGFDLAGPTWIGHDGGAGAAGAAGSGGGGGGGGGGWYASGGAGTGGGGGGGGAGGSAGGAGDGGSYGGGSFGLYLWQSHATILSSAVHAGNGGQAGKGQNGGAGGPGGGGGSGGIVGGGGSGGKGGYGGSGGAGGAGGGAVGGPSLAVFRGRGSTVLDRLSTYTFGTGGNGGQSSGNPGVNGASGALGG